MKGSSALSVLAFSSRTGAMAVNRAWILTERSSRADCFHELQRAWIRSCCMGCTESFSGIAWIDSNALRRTLFRSSRKAS